jgi:hypothetical protein
MIFNPETLKELPVYMNFMVKKHITEVDELVVSKRFGKSNKHNSNKYLVFTPYKQLSNIDKLRFTTKESEK